jgi:hypothetical protein
LENICQLSTGCKIHVDLTNLNGQPALDYAVERSGSGGEGGGETDNGGDTEMLFSKVFYIVACLSKYTRALTFENLSLPGGGETDNGGDAEMHAAT